MRSLLFITRKWEGFGGMQQLSQDLWRSMREMYGGKTRLCAPRMTCKGAGLLGMTHFLIISLLFNLRCLFLGVEAIMRKSHVHLGDATLAPLGWFFKKFGCPVTVTVCGLDVIWKPHWYQWILQRTLPSMDRVVCISRATAQEVKKRGVAEEKIVVIACGVWREKGPNAVGEEYSSPTAFGPSSKPILLTIARLVPRKGVVWFLQEVMPRLLEWKPDLQYWIIGEGPEEKKIRLSIVQMGFEKSVHLINGVGDQELKERLDACSALIVPNIPVEGDMEGFGIVCIEASIRGIPVVAARLEGLCDAVKEGETGVLFTSVDAGDCVRAVHDVIDRRSFGRDAVSRITREHFAWPLLFRRYLHEVFIF